MVKNIQAFVGNLPTNCSSVFDHFVGLALKGLKDCFIHMLSHFDILLAAI